MRWLLVPVLAAALVGVAYGTRHSDKPQPRRPPPHVAHHAVRPSAKARPPQFVVSSFDGSGGARLWAYWRNVAKRAHAHFSFFLSGVYLVDWAHHDDYVPPDRAAGDSAIGFAPDAAWIAAMRKQIALGYREGNEIGTHY